MHEQVPNEWTEPRVARLKQLWAEGFSAAQIARKLNGGFSRSAVLGKIYRLGFRAYDFGQRIKRINVDKLQAPILYAQEPAASYEGFRCDCDSDVTFAALEDHHCRWPLEDAPPFTFCGKARFGAFSYCAAHVRLAYPLLDLTPERDDAALSHAIAQEAA